MKSGSQQQRQFLRKSRVVKVVSEDSWNSLISQATDRGCPVVVHFTASWCVPSLAMNHFFDELSQNYKNCLFLSVDVDDVKSGAMDDVNCGLVAEAMGEDRRLIDNGGSIRQHAKLIEEVAAKWGIKVMPTFVMVKYGAEADKLVGANPIQLRKRIDGFIHSISSLNAEK